MLVVTFDGQTFSFAFDIADPAQFSALLREILDWRMAQYLSRTGTAERTEDVICRVSQNSTGNPILFLPSKDTGGSLPEGPLKIEVDGRTMEAVIAKIAINVVRNLWERYQRETIPPAFGLTFSQAVWNVGFIVKPPHIFLLVTLNKDDMNLDHRYADQFLSDQEFNWQSQNRTNQASRHGRMIHDHKAMGLHVHLLIRPTKRAGKAVTPFIYCGEVDFGSWEGNAPITVRLRLREPVPRTLWSSLKVPG